MEHAPRKLLEQGRHALRLEHHSISTEEPYMDWTRAHILFHVERHPTEMGTSAGDAFLTHMPVNQKAVASTLGCTTGATPTYPLSRRLPAYHRGPAALATPPR